MKKIWIWILFGAIALGAGGYWLYAGNQSPEQVIEYQEITVRQGDISVSFSTDAVVQGEIVSIISPVSERITKMSIVVGTEVKVGQHLFSVDNAKLQYQYNSAMATFSKAVYERNQIDRELKPDDYSAAQQVVNSTWNQVQIAKISLEQASVESPINGVVAEVNARVGEYPSQSAGAVLRIIKKDTLYISTSLDEAEVGKITKSTPVTVDLDALGKKVQGKITSIAPLSVKDSAGYSVYPVTIQLTDKSLPIRVGFEGTVQFVTKTVKDVIQVQASAVFSENGKSYVLKKTDVGSEKVEVSTSFTDGKVAEVTSGLLTGDIVLTRK